MSTTPPGPMDEDLESLLVLTQLSIADLEGEDARHKGKGRADAPLPDGHLAENLQLDHLRALQQLIHDHIFAASIDRALHLDHDFLESYAAVDQAETDDHNAALALSRGQALPLASQYQRSLPALSTSIASAPPDEPAVAEIISEQASQHSYASDLSTSTITLESLKTLKLTPTFPVASVDCIICTDSKIITLTFRAPCGDYYCRTCLVDLVETATHDESLFPVRCCQRPLPVDDFLPYLNPKLRVLFREKALEFGTPVKSRLYCCNPICSVFLGPSQDDGADLVCARCRTVVCSRCKSAGHPGETCTANASLAELMVLAEAEHWQTCPGCGALVELNQGCYHMTCRCRAQFCYLCAAPWKTCACAQWDEHRLLNDAERRVLNEHGERAAVRQPERHVARIEAEVERLRLNHACTDHRWIYRHGEGACEECRHHLPMFLMRCIHCQLLVCRRCAQNRF
ncbi:hypothetical protein BV25DRAFT_1799242 [Artomyces pyxidatus]|uniref:Uncharacterized protein n=1 Tax=Artomyces pyxidatus TaxID=48021 RepID=A0ACB8T8I9_9AGAM|nr:hypothetical protein BV25DRAFT_1799242 [Artomyces pyxidatus]